MTPLDQAFKKAFSRQDAARPAQPPARKPPPEKVPLSAALQADGADAPARAAAVKREDALAAMAQPQPRPQPRRTAKYGVIEPQASGATAGLPAVPQEARLDKPGTDRRLVVAPSTAPCSSPGAQPQPQTVARLEPGSAKLPRPHFNFALQTPAKAVAATPPTAIARKSATPAFLRPQSASPPAAPPEPKPPAETVVAKTAAPAAVTVNPAAMAALDAGQEPGESPSAAPVSPPPPVAAPATLCLLRPARHFDQVAWPAACLRMLSESGGELDRLAEALRAAERTGKKTIGIGASRRGEGATAVLLAAGRRLAERGLRIALVDADWHNPQLHQRLGLRIEAGWEAALAGEAALADVLAATLAPTVALLPLCKAGAVLPDQCAETIHEHLRDLRLNYDLVLVNLGPLADEGSLGGLAGGLDAAVLVQDERAPGDNRLQQATGQLAAIRAAALGVVRNFARKGPLLAAR